MTVLTAAELKRFESKIKFGGIDECCNWHHLQSGSKQDNIGDRQRAGRQPRGPRLRYCSVRLKTASVNSPHQGVYWDARKRKWRAQIRVNGAQFFLGHFTAEDEAARVYRAAAALADSGFVPANGADLRARVA